VLGPPALASVSAEQGRVAVCHAFGIPFTQTIDKHPPFSVYSIPEAGVVGMTEHAAIATGIEVAVGRAWFAENARSRISGRTDGLLELVVDRTDRRLLGVHILGEDAAELVHVGQLAIQAGMDVERRIHLTFIPTRTDPYKYAAYDALGAIDLAAEAGAPVQHDPPAAVEAASP
jgi:NAD(P) transhydrogenase